MGRCFHKGLCFITKNAISWSISPHFNSSRPPKNTNTEHLTITQVIQAVKIETNQYFAMRRCSDKFYFGLKQWEGVLAMKRCFKIDTDGNATERHLQNTFSRVLKVCNGHNMGIWVYILDGGGPKDSENKLNSFLTKRDGNAF